MEPRQKGRCVKAATTAHWEFPMVVVVGIWESYYGLKGRELNYLYISFHQSRIEVAPGDIIQVSLSLFHDRQQVSLADKCSLLTASLSVPEYEELGIWTGLLQPLRQRCT